MRMRRTSALALTMVLALGVTACGGGDDEDSADTTTTEEETTTTEGSGDDGGGTDLGAFSGECEEFYEAFANAGTAVGEAFSGGGEGDLEEVAAYFAEVADDMPDEIADDFEIFAAAYGEFAQALADSGIDLENMQEADPEAMAALQPALEAFSSAEVQEASNNIQAYVEANCSG